MREAEGREGKKGRGIVIDQRHGLLKLEFVRVGNTIFISILHLTHPYILIPSRSVWIIDLATVEMIGGGRL